MVEEKDVARIIKIGAAIVFVILLGINSCSKIKTGHTGILTTFGRVEEQTYGEGLTFKLP